MAFAFSDSLKTSGGWKHYPKNSGITMGMTMKFLPDVGLCGGTESKNWSGQVCKLQTVFPKIPIFGDVTSPNFLGLSILTS